MNNWMQLWIATSKLHSLSQEDNMECPEYGTPWFLNPLGNGSEDKDAWLARLCTKSRET